MAATTGATTPRAEPFRAIDHAPRTPTSLPSISHTGIVSSRDSPRATKTALSIRGSLSPKSAIHGYSPLGSPRNLTGAAALADARRARQQQAREEVQHTSPNPGAVAFNALRGTPGMSRSSDVPPSVTVSEPLQRIAEKIHKPTMTGSSTPAKSTTHNGRTNNTPSAMTATASGVDSSPAFVAEPDSIEDDIAVGRGSSLAPPDDEGSNRPFTYPGPLPSSIHQEGSRRDTYDSSPKTTATKRHKCPYCSTDFTRHHNLKSHLLTHSQEKPYVCQTCQARFRRLHDLKRHSKLHTGERPHTCPKCGRRFARGDALARHNKGPGGCAGRRSSLGGDDDEGDGDDMDGLEYQQGDDEEGNDSEMIDASDRRGSEPRRKRTHLESASDAARDVYRQYSSTYPPPLGRQHGQDAGQMAPPQTVLPSSSTITSPEQNLIPSAGSSYSSQYYQLPGFPQGGMTESPKPLSPGQPDRQRLSVSEATVMRNRSPSLTEQFQQHQYGRGTGRPPPMQALHPPQLPSLPGLPNTGPQQIRMPIQPAHSSALVQQSGSLPSSMSSHSHSGGSIRDIIGHDPQDMWSYIRSLEQRFSRMQDEYELRISRLQEDVISLKQAAYKR